MRRILMQFHLWVGVATILYVMVVCLSGVALLFRPEMQQRLYPRLFVPASTGAVADPAMVIRRVAEVYPQGRVSGIDAPTRLRRTYLAYVAVDGGFRTVLLDPISAQVLGEFPDRSVIRALQALHFELMSGATGRKVNGVGAACLLLLGLSGLFLWWSDGRPWARRFKVQNDRDWRQVCRDVHTAVAIWAFLPLVVWALTGMHFVWPAQFRAAVSWISPVTAVAPPASIELAADRRRAADIETLLRIARLQRPGMHVARVVLPATERGAVQVMFSLQSPTHAGAPRLQSVYLDQYSGAVLPGATDLRTMGDIVLAWAAPLHVGNFGGSAVRILWLLLGLALPLLALTAAVMGWTRVMRRPR